MRFILVLVYLAVFLISMLGSSCATAAFSQKLDLQFRFDDRSNRDIRYQYRARYYPQYSFNKSWSAHGFLVTGDDFSSSHNTLDDGEADYFYMRRLFVRHSGSYGKTEMGFIPTFKGRVSSTGLSKDGWIAGIRHVTKLGDYNQLEIVLGKLDSVDPSKALDTPEDINYIEIEYSAQIDEFNSYEFSFERMTGGNFVRTEYRYNMSSEATIFAELVKRIDRSEEKLLVGIEVPMQISGYTIESFSYYSYVSENFGQRADLIEDFIGEGHGFSSELSGSIADSGFDWFVRYDTVETSSRVLAGLKWSM